ncbi:MAG: radical SAM protein [Desulfuromonadales bacterium]|nr:MAG: radical SAM protein [Desulfuromonadales bacterium]
MSVKLPPAICFRVTRSCNARCGFCLAPPAGVHQPAEALMHRLDWLLSHGVKSIHFCGGEPTIHPSLPQLLAYAHARGAKTKITTNAITLPDALLPFLRATGTQVKVSLHGDREHHNTIVGIEAFDHTTGNLRRLIAAGVSTSVQTTVIAGGTWVVEWMIDFCLEHRVRRLSILPFIPRGNGFGRQSEYGLRQSQRRELHELVTTKRRALSSRLDLRWLDFTARPVHVVEPDGKVVLEGATETGDTLLYRIPASDR